MIFAEIAVVWLALTLAFLVLIALPDYLYAAARAAREHLDHERRRRRIDADRRIVNGEEPLPPGVSLSDAYARAARDGVPLATAAAEIHREETSAILRKAFRPPRPGD